MTVKEYVQRYWRWLAWSGMALLGVLIIYNVMVTWRLLLSAPALDNDDPDNKPTSELAVTVDIANIPNWHLFGQAAVKDAQQLPATRLQLNLMGIMQAGDPDYSQAVISAANGETRVYIIGDDLPGGATLKQVLPYSVIIEYNGELEKLALPNAKLEFAPPPRPLSTAPR